MPHTKTALLSLAALSALSVPACIPDSIEVGPNPSLPNVERVTRENTTGSVRITDKIETSDGRPVKRNPQPWYGSGFIIGSPISSGNQGFLFKTYELHINQGAFQDDPSYLGSAVQLSVDGKNQTIYDSFRAVEQEKRQQYIFQYVEKHPLNAEIESSHYFLQKVYTPSEFLRTMNVSTLSKGVRAKEPFVGSAGNISKVGRIVDIERSGQLDDFCTVEINMSGLGTAGGEKLIALSVRDEDIAVWCEKAMAVGRDVEIEVAQDFMEVWMKSPMVINEIKFRDLDVKPTGSVVKNPGGEVTQEQYESIRNKLMADPVFMQRVRRGQ